MNNKILLLIKNKLKWLNQLHKILHKKIKLKCMNLTKKSKVFLQILNQLKKFLNKLNLHPNPNPWNKQKQYECQIKIWFKHLDKNKELCLKDLKKMIRNFKLKENGRKHVKLVLKTNQTNGNIFNVIKILHSIYISHHFKSKLTKCFLIPKERYLYLQTNLQLKSLSNKINKLFQYHYNTTHLNMKLKIFKSINFKTMHPRQMMERIMICLN